MYSGAQCHCTLLWIEFGIWASMAYSTRQSKLIGNWSRNLEQPVFKLKLHCKFLILIMRRKKKLKTGKNLLVLSKSLLVAIQEPETHWDSLWFKKCSIRVNSGSFWVKTFLFGNWIRLWENDNIWNCLTEKVYFLNENFFYPEAVLQRTLRNSFISISDEFDSVSNMLRKLQE